jgi:8-oxo-dGTP diphosphatase
MKGLAQSKLGTFRSRFRELFSMQPDINRPRAKIIRIAVAIIRNDRGEMLVVRKRGSRFFIQPGGKIEPGESPEAALKRELLEELSCAVATTRYCGKFSERAVNEADHIVEADFFFVEAEGEIAAGAEIEEICWINPKNCGNVALAPLTAKYAAPLAANESAKLF